MPKNRFSAEQIWPGNRSGDCGTIEVSVDGWTFGSRRPWARSRVTRSWRRP
jgi:hypothetical protein